MEQKIKGGLQIFDRRDIYAIFIIIFVSFCSYYIGRISVVITDKNPVIIEKLSPETPVEQGAAEVNIDKNTGQNMPAVIMTGTSSQEQANTPKTSAKGLYVGSKNGTKYHLESCPGAKQIALANQIWFASKAEAERAGYSPAGNCSGI